MISNKQQERNDPYEIILSYGRVIRKQNVHLRVNIDIYRFSPDTLLGNRVVYIMETLILTNMSTNHLSCCECNRKSEIFKYLSKDELALVDKHRTEVAYKPGEIIVKQGSPVTHVISFSSGLAKVSIEGHNQKNLILRFLTPTLFIGGPGLYVDRLHHFSVTALESSRVCFIDFSVFKTLIRQNCDFADAFIKYISKEGIFDYNRFISLTQKHMHGRIADALIYLDKEVFCNKESGIRISRNDLAEFTGMSADSAIRILKQMSLDGIIETQGRTLRILNIDELKKLSQIG